MINKCITSYIFYLKKRSYELNDAATILKNTKNMNKKM